MNTRALHVSPAEPKPEEAPMQAAGASPANEASTSASKRTRRPRKERNADKAPEQVDEKKRPALAVVAPESQSSVAPQVCTPRPTPTSQSGTLSPLHGRVGSGRRYQHEEILYDCLFFMTEWRPLAVVLPYYTSMVACVALILIGIRPDSDAG
jgi:hypothetical protein